MSEIFSPGLEGLGPLRPAVDEAFGRLEDGDVPARVWTRDHTVWSPEPVEIENRLGWLDAPESPPEPRDAAERLLREVRQRGVDRAALLGMGGSSLAPEVFAKIFGSVADGLDLRVLDSTDPAAVRETLDWASPSRTLVIVSSKSGTTVETRSMLRAFWTRAARDLGSEAAAARFAVVTDPGTPLADLADRLGFARVFAADPEVGGRYSALTWFGLAPATLLGIDVERLLQAARSTAQACRARDPRRNPGGSLGAVLGAAAGAGRDKLTLVFTPEVEPFGAWIEQLIAESTGKSGHGILPIVESRPGAGEYGDDRLFVHVRLEGEDPHGEAVAALQSAGQPVVRLLLADRHDLGGHLFGWEFATAIAGHLMGVHPLDQPNVEAAKAGASERMEAYRRTGSLEEPEPDVVDGDLSAWTGFAADDLRAALDGLVERTVDDGYLAIQAFLPPTERIHGRLEALADALRARTGLAVTVGFGPRYLHSTGQLHKGDAGDGVFLMLTAPTTADVPIPDEPGSDSASVSFGVLERAQALGDRRALRDAGRVVVRVDLGSDVGPGLERLTETVAGQSASGHA